MTGNVCTGNTQGGEKKAEIRKKPHFRTQVLDNVPQRVALFGSDLCTDLVFSSNQQSAILQYF